MAIVLSASKELALFLLNFILLLVAVMSVALGFWWGFRTYPRSNALAPVLLVIGVIVAGLSFPLFFPGCHKQPLGPIT
jgi:hypothetical protein